MGILPSLAIGIGAFCAGELVFQVAKKEEPMKVKNMYEVLTESKNMNDQIEKIIPKIEDKELTGWIKEIHETVSKIIQTIEKKPEKYKTTNNFFHYYLPVTIQILKKYDEIENQKLTTQESKEFMESTKRMVKKIKDAFELQLAHLYQSDMLDVDAEMKVFESMLKSEGYHQDSDFGSKKEEKS